MNTEKAKRIVRKYKLALALLLVCLLVIYFLIDYLFRDSYYYIGILLLTATVIFAVFRRVQITLSKKQIIGIIENDLDGLLYREVIRLAKYGERDILHAIQSEYFAGNIADAIRLCEAVRKNPRIFKKDSHYTLLMLANCYFDLGEYDKLAEVCREFGSLKSQKKNSDKFWRIRMYELFLSGNFDECIGLQVDRKDNLYKIGRAYIEARIFLERGERDEARARFADISDTAQSCIYGTLSRWAIYAIDNDVEYNEAVKALGDGGELDCGYMMAKNKKSGVMGAIAWGIAVICLLYVLGSAVMPTVLRWTRLYSFREHVALIEEFYGEIEMIDAFDYSENDEVVERMFLCYAEGEVIFGSQYLDNEGEWQIKIYESVELSEFDGDDDLYICESFTVYGSGYMFYYCFSEYADNLPDDRLLSSYYTVEGRRFTFAIAES